MYRGKHVVAHNTLVEHDGVLVVVTLPWHVSHKEVASECELTILGGITFGKNVACLHTLPFAADRTQVDGHILVCTAELRYSVFLQCGLETYEFLILSTVVEYTDGCRVYIFYYTFAFGSNHSA